MFTKDENYLSMARNVASVLKDYEGEWKILPKFSTYAYDFYKLMGINSRHKSNADIESTGATTDKEAAGDYVVEYASKLTKRATNYALDTNNAELADQLKIHKSELKHGHDSAITDKMNDVMKRMKAIEDKLKDYGVGAEQFKIFEQAIDRYESLLDQPRKLIRDRKGFNIQAIQSLGKIKVLITKMDNAINYFEDSRFEIDYNNARIVIDLGMRKGKGKGKGDENDDPKPDSKDDVESKEE